MALRIDPRIPVVWRSPETLQLGVRRPLATVERADAVDVVLIDALRIGTVRSALDVLAHELGGDARQVDILLASVERALVGDAPTSRRRIVVDAQSAAAARVAESIEGLGFEVAATMASDHCTDADNDNSAGTDLVVLVADYVVDPRTAGRLQSLDIPHLPVVLDDAGAHIGPLVVPGSAPCLACVELERARIDEAWPVIAAQLLGRAVVSRAACHTPVRIQYAAAAEASSAVAAFVDTGENPLASAILTVDGATGMTSRSSVTASEECACRSLSGTVTTLVPRADDRPARPSSRRVAAVPA